MSNSGKGWMEAENNIRHIKEQNERKRKMVKNRKEI